MNMHCTVEGIRQNVWYAVDIDYLNFSFLTNNNSLKILSQKSGTRESRRVKKRPNLWWGWSILGNKLKFTQRKWNEVSFLSVTFLKWCKPIICRFRRLRLPFQFDLFLYAFSESRLLNNNSENVISQFTKHNCGLSFLHAIAIYLNFHLTSQLVVAIVLGWRYYLFCQVFFVANDQNSPNGRDYCRAAPSGKKNEIK